MTVLCRWASTTRRMAKVLWVFVVLLVNPERVARR